MSADPDECDLAMFHPFFFSFGNEIPFPREFLNLSEREEEWAYAGSAPTVELADGN